MQNMSYFKTNKNTYIPHLNLLLSVHRPFFKVNNIILCPSFLIHQTFQLQNIVCWAIVGPGSKMQDQNRCISKHTS